jgi:molybdopterin-guanine dinucleotide biosynthesis protein A
MGRPKAWLEADNELLLVRIARERAQILSPLVLVAAVGQPLPEVPNVEIVRDTTSDRGPLEGLATGLAALEGRVEAAFVQACDMPSINNSYILTLLKAFAPDIDVVLPVVQGYRQPWAAIYRTHLTERVRELLEAGETHPRALLESCAMREVTVADATCLRNLNTPDDYAAWRAE